jgi:hypothetical protein
MGSIVGILPFYEDLLRKVDFYTKKDKKGIKKGRILTITPNFSSFLTINLQFYWKNSKNSKKGKNLGLHEASQKNLRTL